MRVRILSDIHFEFMDDGGKRFLQKQDDHCDGVIVAGDVCDGKLIGESLARICERFRGKPVIYVTGNHEYYYSSKERVLHQIGDLQKVFSNFFPLENSSADIGGYHFHGTTLWFEHNGILQSRDQMMNDFSLIDGFNSWIAPVHKKAAQYLRDNVKHRDVVITHHLPSNDCVSLIYEGWAGNRYFVHDMTDVIYKNKPALWVFGHTHESVRGNIGDTHFICNPYGYENRGSTLVNSAFDPGLTVDLSSDLMGEWPSLEV